MNARGCGIDVIRDFIQETCGDEHERLTLIDGSNIFYFDSELNEWQRAEEKAKELRSITPGNNVVIFMKTSTFDIMAAKFPIRRFLSTVREVCIVLVDIPFCTSRLMVNCIRKMKFYGTNVCSLSRRSKHRPHPYARPPQQVTNFRHLYCEYDDVMLSDIFYKLSELPQIISLDCGILKSSESIDAFEAFNPVVRIKLLTVAQG